MKTNFLQSPGRVLPGRVLHGDLAGPPCSLAISVQFVEAQFNVNDLASAHSEIFSKFYQIKPKSNFIYLFPIDLEPNRRSFGSKSIGKW